MKPVYEGNPKHKTPWQPGRKGSLCPPDISIERVRELLHLSVVEGKKRYAADKGRAFCAQQHDVAKDRWHGYPVGWREVPAEAVEPLMKRGDVTKRDLKKYWEDAQ